MSIEASPAFQFYVKEWRSSRAIMRMTMAQQGMYLNLLLEQWEKLSVPDDPNVVAELIGGTEAEWVKAWPVLRRNFVTDEPGRIVNLRLEKERAKQRSRSKRQSDKGKAGAAARWPKHESGMAQASPGHDRDAQPDSFALPIAIAIATPDGAAMQRAKSLEPEDVARRAGQLVERYGDWFTELRRGARLKVRPALDWQEACDLVRLWADERLEKLARIILTTDDEWIARTDRSFKIFAIKATWADGKLTQWEHEQGQKVTA